MASTIISTVVSYAYPVTNGLNMNKIISNKYKNDTREIYKQWHAVRQRYFMEKKLYYAVITSRSLIDNKIEELKSLFEMTGYLGNNINLLCCLNSIFIYTDYRWFYTLLFCRIEYTFTNL